MSTHTFDPIPQKFINSLYFLVKMHPAYAGSTFLHVNPKHLRTKKHILSPRSKAMRALLVSYVGP